MLACTMAGITGLFVKHKVSDTMRIISILTALDQLRVTVKIKINAATLERDTRAIASVDSKLLTTAAKVEAVLDVKKREAKIAKEMPK